MATGRGARIGPSIRRIPRRASNPIVMADHEGVHMPHMPGALGGVDGVTGFKETAVLSGIDWLTASLTGFHLGLLVGCTIKVAAPKEGRVDCDRFNPASPLVLSLRPTSINTASVLVSASYAAPPRSSSARRPDPATLRPLGSHVVSSRSRLQY